MGFPCGHGLPMDEVEGATRPRRKTWGAKQTNSRENLREPPPPKQSSVSFERPLTNRRKGEKPCAFVPQNPEDDFAIATGDFSSKTPAPERASSILEHRNSFSFRIDRMKRMVNSPVGCSQPIYAPERARIRLREAQGGCTQSE